MIGKDIGFKISPYDKAYLIKTYPIKYNRVYCNGLCAHNYGQCTHWAKGVSKDKDVCFLFRVNPQAEKVSSGKKGYDFYEVSTKELPSFIGG